MYAVLFDGETVSNILPTQPVLHPSILVVQVGSDVQTGWKYANGVFSSPVAPAPTKEELVAYAADVRWQHETGGVTVGGVAITTDRTSQTMLANIVTMLVNNPSLPEIKFKAPSGWVTIPRVDMIAIGAAVGNYVQSCFEVEASMDEAISTGAVSTYEEIDGAAWPSTSVGE